MKLRFTQWAIRHLEAIADYISQRNPDAALRVGARIRETTELLAAFPHIGHAGALEGTREVVVPALPYIIVHRSRPAMMTLSSSSASITARLRRLLPFILLNLSVDLVRLSL